LGVSGQFKGEGKNIILIGFIARHDPMKDHPTFFKAASELLQERENVHFILAGNGVKPENRSIAMQISDIWKDHFHLLGEREDIEKITAALDIASLASHGEGFPNIICEAMACEVPCVTTDVGDAAFIVNNTGYVVPTRDSRAMAGAWKVLIDLGEERRRELGLSARKRVMAHFELSKVVKEYEGFYTSLCSQPLSL
jgi:glycosyltransferase involved in cell wall biosynthesis